MTNVDRKIASSDTINVNVGQGLSPGAAWLLATASRVAEVQQGVAERHGREPLLTLHAHRAVEEPHLDACISLEC
jgi:hypothetical protein